MRIDKETKVCISIAARPSNFGTTLHNAGYQALGLNFVYKAFAATDISSVIAGVRALGIRGLSVSMPFKEAIIPYLDEVDEAAERVGAVNTVVNENGKLSGYNTDIHGALVALRGFGDLQDARVLLLGAGGVAQAVLAALLKLKVSHIVIANRNVAKASQLATRWGCEWVSWDARDHVDVDLLVNATSVGMSPHEQEMPVQREAINKVTGVLDVVLTPMESMLIREATRQGKRISPGYVMSLHQALAQFEIYTGSPAPRDVFEAELKRLLEPYQK